MKLYNTATDTFLGDYPGTVDEALDAYARDSGWSSWRLWELFSDMFRSDLSDAVARSVGYESWAEWSDEGTAPRELPRPAPVGELTLCDASGEAYR